VSQWRDKSGFNYHMTPTSAGPTRNSSLNSRKTLLITSAQQIGNLSINLQTSANTVFVVSRLTGGANGRVLTAYYNNWLLGHWGGQTDKYYAEGWVYDTYNAADTAWRIHTGDWSGSSTDLANFYSSGTTLATNSSAASQGPSGLGINSQGYELSNAEAAEIIVFNRILTTAERRLVHTYLGQKWGILNTDRSIIDLSGFNDNGLLGNGTTTAMPAFDYYNKGALRFDGTDDYLSVADNVALNPTAVTVSMWLKRNAYQSSICNFLRRNDRDAYALMATYNTDTVWFRIRNAAAAVVDATTTMPLNTWTNLVGTFDGSNVRIYKDGALANTVANTSPISYSGSTIGDLIIARDDIVSGRYAPINVGATLIYSKALSAVEIAQNYEAQKAKFTNTIVQQGLILNLDASNPYSYAGAGTTFYDVSGNNNYFQLTNSPTYVSTDPKNFSLSAASSQHFLYYASIGNPTGSTGISLPSANSWTCAFWFRTSTNTTYNPFLSHMGSGPVYCIMGTTGTTLTYYHYNGGWFFKNATTNILDNVWHQAVFVNTANTMIIYLDGVVEKASFDSTVSGPSNLVNGFGGSWTATFTGNLANFMYYNTNLSAAQVLQNYNATKGRFGL
jgi:hypothetical protein